MTSDTEFPAGRGEEAEVLCPSETALSFSELPTRVLPRTRDDVPLGMLHLCIQLHETFSARDYPNEALRRQAHLLDQMLCRYVAENIDGGTAGAASQLHPGHLNMLLRLQRQCADTFKTNATIEYMNALIMSCGPKFLEKIPRPHPPENPERTE